MKNILVALLSLIVIASCTPDMENQVIVSKSSRNHKAYKDKLKCWYNLKGVSIGFYAPCDCYEVGDSTNKYMRYYQEHNKKNISEI